MNYTVFLGLLSGEMLFTNTYVLFSMPKVKTKSPQNPKQNKPKQQSLQNPPL